MHSVNDKFAPPQGFTFGNFTNERGHNIRYGQMKTAHKKPVGTLVLGPGYGEAIEKYFELVTDLTARGYNIYIIDWMGQGGSDRKSDHDRQKPYDVADFMQHHQDDLYHLVTKIVDVPKNEKLGYMGFSMGGHIGANFVRRHNYIFDAISFNAAFFDMNSRGFPRSAIGTIAKSYRLSGKGDNYVPTGGPWSSLKHEFNKNTKTSDPGRHRRMIELFENKQDLQLGDFTVNWVHHVLPSIGRLNRKDALAKIITPAHFAIAGKDKTVSIPAQKRAAKYVNFGQQHYYPYAKHEIWIEKNSTRDVWLRDADSFFKNIMGVDMEPVRINRLLVTPHQKPKFKR